MGFSWSSFVAQGYLLARCKAAWLALDSFLADDDIAPTTLKQTFGLATGYQMVFTVDDERLACSTVRRFDEELMRAGVVRAAEKYITAACDPLGIPCIGVDVCNGSALEPAKGKLARLVTGAGQLVANDMAVSPLGLGVILGHMSWFAQLNRPVFSCFDNVYPFTRIAPYDRALLLSDDAAVELLLCLVLTPLLAADL